MDSFSVGDLRVLTKAQTEPCVSVYLPTHVSGQDGEQDRVRLKNLVRQAEEQLASDWLRAVEARQLLEPILALPLDPGFWDERGRGLAVFVSPDSFHRFRLAVELDELAVVNRRFHVKPLLPVLSDQARFLILALSQNSVRLFSASRNHIEQVEVSGLPSDVKSALNYTDSDRGSQVHSAMQGSMGKQAAVFHGHGGQQDTRKDDLATFFRQVDAALKPVLHEQQTPLLLAGVENVLGIFRDVNGYPHLVDQQVEGNCDHLAPHELLQRAWPLIAPTVEQARNQTAKQIVELAATQKTANDLKQILPSAHAGKVDTLFVDVKAHQWGVFDAESQDVELHDEDQPGDDDLLDLAAVQTLLHRGTVYAVPRDQIPDHRPTAALFRY